MGFHQQSMWLRAAFILTCVGFIVWLSAYETFLLDSQQQNAYVAFLIIGILTYYAGLVVIFMYVFLDFMEGNKLVLLINAGVLLVAGISGLISASIARTVTHSDRIGWALICALISAAFLILSVFSGVGAGTGSQPQQQQQQHQQQHQPTSPPMSNWHTNDTNNSEPK